MHKWIFLEKNNQAWDKTNSLRSYWEVIEGTLHIYEQDGSISYFDKNIFSWKEVEDPELSSWTKRIDDISICKICNWRFFSKLLFTNHCSYCESYKRINNHFPNQSGIQSWITKDLNIFEMDEMINELLN